MKMASKISVTLNLALAGLLLFAWLNARQPHAASAPAPGAEKPALPVMTQTASTAGRPVAMETKAFRWSQLVDTNNYRQFVANLRESGCPESTVEDIVQGDIARVFKFKRAELHTDEAASGPWSTQSQIQLEAYMLGRIPPAAMAAVSTENESQSPAVTDPSSQSEDAPVPALTTFLENADLTPSEFNDEQKQQVANLRQSLLRQITALNQFPGDTAVVASQPGSDGAQLPAAQPGVIQIGTGNSPGNAGTPNAPGIWHPLPQSTLTTIQGESMVGGMFGSGAAMQYEQYQAAQPGQQSQRQ